MRKWGQGDGDKEVGTRKWGQGEGEKGRQGDGRQGDGRQGDRVGIEEFDKARNLSFDKIVM